MGGSSSKADRKAGRAKAPKERENRRSRSVPASRSRNKKKLDNEPFCDDGHTFDLNGNTIHDINGNVRDIDDQHANGHANGDANGDMNGNAHNGNYHHDFQHDNDTSSPEEEPKELKRSWSTRSLNRIRNSFRHKNLSAWSLNCITKPRTPLPEFGDSEPEVPKENLFAKLYDKNIHKTVFKYFDFNERLRLREVCQRWKTDLFTGCEHFRYPCFSEDMDYNFCLPSEHGQRMARTGMSILKSNHLVYLCEKALKSVEFTRVSESILKHFYNHCYAMNLKELHFRPNSVKREVINGQFMSKFFEKFGKNLEVISIDPKLISRTVISDITDTILLFTFLSREHLKSLQSLTLQISNLRTTKLFSTFFTDEQFQKQLREVSLELTYPKHEFEVGLERCMETIDTFRHLSKLTLKLVPYSSDRENELDWEDIFDTINNTVLELNMASPPTVIINYDHLNGEINPDEIRTQCRESFGEGVQVFFENQS